MLKLFVFAGMQLPFNWFKNWYPVGITDDLDPLKPFATKLLGARPSPAQLWASRSPQKQPQLCL